MNVLSLNPGSSSLKFALHQVESGDTNRVLVRGVIDRLGTSGSTLRLSVVSQPETTLGVPGLTLTEAVGKAIESCIQRPTIDAVGTRVVHGGSQFWEPARIDDQVLDTIRALSPLAPLHNARDLETIEAARKTLAKVPVVAVFDTSFHRTIPWYASHYAIPKELAEKHGIRRYGFHGISYRYVSEFLKPRIGPMGSRLVICHLGSGASACAVLNGTSVDTSMGMTPLEGLVMGTRSGDIDPGVILYLQRELGMSFAEVDEMLNHKSGLAGLSGLSGDARELEEAALEGSRPAVEALEIFAYRVAKYVGSYAAALQGSHSLTFCGGIGENSSSMRERICRRLGFLGFKLDRSLNERKLTDDASAIHAPGSLPIWVVKTDEEQQIAKETFGLMSR